MVQDAGLHFATSDSPTLTSTSPPHGATFEASCVVTASHVGVTAAAS